MKKKPFVVDYEVVGSLHLSCRSSPAAAVRAVSRIQAALLELREISVYCEENINEPIDATERYWKYLGRSQEGGKNG